MRAEKAVMHEPGTFADTLARACEGLSQSITRAAIEKMALHWELVCSWNARTNLTAIESNAEAAWRHYRDSLELSKHLHAATVLDIGSGAGFPGIPLAIVLPDTKFTLLEPRRKRASFLRVAQARLQLSNVNVLQARHADVPDQLYEAATSRATFSDSRELLYCLRWLAPGGRLFALQTASDLAPAQATEVHLYELLDTQRQVVVWTRK